MPGILPHALLGQNSSAQVGDKKKSSFLPQLRLAAFGCPTVCGIWEVFIRHGQAQSNVSMSPRTDSAGGGFAGNKPRRPQSNRSRVLMCGVARVRVCIAGCVRQHIPKRTSVARAFSSNSDQQTSFVSTLPPIETTFLV